MDDILKKAMFQEVHGLMEQIEDICQKYGHSGELVYTAAFGVMEEQGEVENRWSLAYGHNCRDNDEFTEFMTLQVKAFTEIDEDEEPDVFTGYSLN